MHVAFANLASSGWTAGGHYLKNLFFALKSLDKPAQPDISLLVTQGTPFDLFRFLTPYINNVIFITETKWQRYWKSAYLRLPIPDWLEGLALPRRLLVSQLSKNQVDVLFSNDEYGPNFPVPLLTWIPDFQHVHLPELFSSSKIRTRDRHNQRIGRFADRIMLSSHDAFRDFKRKIPQAQKKVKIVSFVAQIPDDVYKVDPLTACDPYHLPRKFFFLPNQFWVHKNHVVVIDALTLLSERRRDIAVVCTGNPTEFRIKDYYAQIVSTIRERGLEDLMKLLGMVPHEHIFQLMRQSLSVLQPSLFEGWSTTIEEAKSLGKGVIASDIPVHREQNPPEPLFFQPHDPPMLADLLEKVFDRKMPGPDAILEANARINLPLRTRTFAEQFMGTVGETVLAHAENQHDTR